MNYKKGDKIRCIEVGGAISCFTKNRIYTIIDKEPDLRTICNEGTPHWLKWSEDTIFEKINLTQSQRLNLKNKYKGE